VQKDVIHRKNKSVFHFSTYVHIMIFLKKYFVLIVCFGYLFLIL